MSKKLANSEPEVLETDSLPVNLPVEREVLGALIEDSGLVPEVIRGLTLDDFSIADHRRVFLAIRELVKAGSPVDVLSVSEQLGNRQHDVEIIGGLISGVVLVKSHILHHVGILRRKARLRSLAKLGRWLSDSACNPGADPDDLIRRTTEQFSGVRETDFA